MSAISADRGAATCLATADLLIEAEGQNNGAGGLESLFQQQLDRRPDALLEACEATQSVSRTVCQSGRFCRPSYRVPRRTCLALALVGSGLLNREPYHQSSQRTAGVSMSRRCRG